MPALLAFFSVTEGSQMQCRWLGTWVVAGTVLLAACSASSQDAAGPTTASEVPPDAASVSYIVLEEVTTAISGIDDRRRVVIRDEVGWASFWDEFAVAVEPRPDPPPVDFVTHMVIVATMGQRSSGGYTISVEQVAEKNGILYARVLEASPAVSCVNITVMTAPAVAVTVPRHDGTVAFVEEELELPCTP